MESSFLPCAVEAVESPNDASFDCVLLVAPSVDAIKPAIPQLAAVADTIQEQLKLDSGMMSGNSIVLSINSNIHPSGRLVLAPTGSILCDMDDVRRYHEAAFDGIRKCISAGARKPLLITVGHKRFEKSELVALLGALAALYVPLEIREIQKITDQRKYKADKLGVWSPNTNGLKETVRIACAIETGRYFYRDVGGSDPERMAPPAVADYVKQAFKGSSSIKVTVIDDQKTIKSEYPLMAAVNRCANTVPRHQARLIKLEYTGEGNIDETLIFVGKGVTLDTGGTDLKVNGIMYGMSRDKLGATTVGGFFKVLEALRPRGLKCIGFMCMVRNSIGAESYTCDEIITARSGKRIRIVNTDAEGRLTMLDPLCHAREMAQNETNPHIMTIATLTGHAVLAMGTGYSIAIDNGPALAEDSCHKLHRASETIGDIVEISILRREDYQFAQPESEYEDLRQSNTKPSSQTERGHMGPAAFMILGSRLDEHGTDSQQPIKYTHIDMAGAEKGCVDVPIGKPIAALVQRYVLPRI